MDKALRFSGAKSNKCLLVLGGYGDTVQVFSPLIIEFEKKLTKHVICAFDFTFKSNGRDIFPIQTQELFSVMEQLHTNKSINRVDIFTTSMGAYSTVKLLSNKSLTHKIQNVVMYDPADYLLDSSSGETWSGCSEYPPKERVISDEISAVKGGFVVHVVHLTLRNYSPTGYIDKQYSDRGVDHPDGYPRLNSAMVKAFYHKTPESYRGRYIEEPAVPHGFIRDGNVQANLVQIANSLITLLGV